MEDLATQLTTGTIDLAGEKTGSYGVINEQKQICTKEKEQIHFLVSYEGGRLRAL